jgi:transmembrane sensor
MSSKLLIKKFLNKTATTEEIVQLLKHMNENNQDEWAELIKKEWDKASFSAVPNKDFQRIYQEISETIYRKKKSGSHKMLRVLKWAASFSLLFIAVYLIYNSNFTKPSNNLMKIEMVEKNNPIGQKSKIQLPDGTVVWLNADSKLLFPSRFDSTRKVEITGEAYFEVVSNPEKPFLVTSENVTIQALGTAFNVRAYHEEDLIQVALTEGKVKVSINKNNDYKAEDYEIDPGLSVVYWKKNEKVDRSPFSFNEVAGWKEGILAFRNSDRDEVFTILARWYGVRFEFKNSPSDNNWDYIAQFKNEYLENILVSIGSIKNFDFKIDNSVVEIIYH